MVASLGARAFPIEAFANLCRQWFGSVDRQGPIERRGSPSQIVRRLEAPREPCLRGGRFRKEITLEFEELERFGRAAALQ